MAETKCPKCGAPLESEEELCDVCDAGPDSVKSPSKMAPPPPAKTPSVPPTAEESAAATGEAPPPPVDAPAPTLVGDIMTRKLATLFEGESLFEAAKGLRHVKFRHVPVIGPEGFLIGLVSLRDVIRAMPSSLEPNSDTKAAELLQRHRVGDVMERNVKTVAVDTPLEEAGQLMVDQRRDCLPVVDESGNLIGLVTATDYIRLAVSFLKKA